MDIVKEIRISKEKFEKLNSHPPNRLDITYSLYDNLQETTEFQNQQSPNDRFYIHPQFDDMKIRFVVATKIGKNEFTVWWEGIPVNFVSGTL